MRRLIFLSMILPFIAHAGDSPEGVWLTENGDAQVEISPCGEALCGHMVWLREPNNESGDPKLDTNNPDEDLRGQEVLGMRLLWDMEPARQDGRWSGGRVYDPESGNVYRGRIELVNADTLELRGYVGLPAFGRSSTWTREEAVRSLP